MLAAKHFDPVVGVDIHLVVIPPAGPVPIPHPHIGMVMDAIDYVAVLGATVFIGGIPRASAGTAGQPVPHIPMGGPFSKLPGNEDETFMGSSTVLAESAPFTFSALPVLSCQAVGMMAPVRAKKPKKSYGMVLPTSVVMPIPAGLPVMIGGPPTIDMVGMAMRGGMAAMGGAFKKMRKMRKKAKRVKKASKAAKKKANKATKEMGVPPNARNKVHKSKCTVTGHPVDVASGKVFTDHVDFELPGPLPLRWERSWFSTSVYQGPVGHGWHHSYDLKLAEEERSVAVRLADGRPVAFPALKPGEISFDRADRLTLSRDEHGYALDTADGLRYRFAPHNGDAANQPLESVSDRAGSGHIRFYYNRDGHLEHIVDSGGRTVRIQNNPDGTIHRIFLPEPDPAKRGQYFCAVEYRYRDNDMVAARDALGHELRYQYDHHLLVRETDRNGLSFYFEYDRADHAARCLHTWGDGGIYDHRLHYDINENITTVRNSLGHKTAYYHDGALVHRTVDPLGAETRTNFNEHGQPLCETDELDNKTEYEYDERGNTVKVTNPDGATLAIEYDEHDNPVCLTDPLGGEWRWRYDAAGRLVSSTDALDRTTRIAYEGDKPAIVVDPAGGQTRLAYDLDANLRAITTPDGGQSAWEYDALGRVIRATDPNGNHRQLRYDLAGRVTGVLEPDGNQRALAYDAEGNVTRAKDKQFDVAFQYAGMGRLIARSEAGTTVKFEYDTEEQLTGIVNEHGHAYRFALNPIGDILAESGFDGLIRRYRRDAAGRVTRVQRPGERRSDYFYDPMGRVTRIRHSDGSEEQYQYRPDGELISAENNNTGVEFKRDAIGQILKETQGDHWVCSEYNPLGQRIRMWSSMGAEQTIERNAMGDVTRVVAGSEQQWETVFQRDLLGLEVERSLPGGVRSRWERDRLGRPRQHRIVKGDQIHSSRQYVWSYNDRLVKVIDHLNRETVYNHDALGNLVSARYENGQFDLRMPDAVGNLFRTHARDDREYGPAGQLLSVRKPGGVVRYQYDPEGNLICKTEPDGRAWHYEWNGAGMLARVVRPDGKDVTFQYDPLGRRIGKTFNGKTTRWVWDGDNPLHEWVEHSDKDTDGAGPAAASDSAAIAIDQRDAALQPQQAQAPPAAEGTPDEPITWLFEPDSFAPMAKLVGSEYYSIVADYLGIPTAMYDRHGETVWSADISVWGQVRSLKGPRGACPFRWPGQYEDTETGLYYNRYRYYDVDAGHYTSRDPIGLLGGFNVYAYVPDPTTWYDPLGLSGCRSNGVKEGIYEFTDTMGKKYVGQSKNISRRLKAHIKSGKLDPKQSVKTTKVSGGKTAREIAEHKRIQQITGGVPARRSNVVSNQVDPIGPNRRHLL